MKPPARVILVISLVTSPLALSPAFASCLAPSLRVEPAIASPGDTVTFVGDSFSRGCDDTPGPCSGIGRGSDPEKNISIILVHGPDPVHPIDVVSADDSASFRGTFVVPDRLVEGRPLEGRVSIQAITQDRAVYTAELQIRPRS